MSIGNLKDYGNKGNNFPWQLKVLQGLQTIIDSGCCNDLTSLLSDINDKLKPSQKTPGIISAVGSGSTPPNVYSMSIANVGASAGVLNGVSVPPGATLNFDAGVLNNTLSQMSYDATGTTFIITYIS